MSKANPCIVYWKTVNCELTTVNGYEMTYEPVVEMLKL